MTIWKAASQRFDELWATHDKFMSKINLVALNEYLAEKLAFAWEVDLIDIEQLDQIESHMKMTLAALEPDFWTREWNIKLSYSALVRTLIKSDLHTMAQNSKNPHNKWHSGLELLKAK